MARRQISQFFYIHREPLRLHKLSLDAAFGQVMLTSDDKPQASARRWGARRSSGWHGHTSWNESVDPFHMDCHHLGEASTFVRRIQFEPQPYWRRYHFEVFVGHQTHIITNGQFQERLVRNWCVILRVIPRARL